MNDDIKWATSVADAQIGESLWLCNGQMGRHRGDRIVQVTKRGRSLLTINQYGRDCTYRMEDGRDSKHTSRTPGPPSFLYTEAQRLHSERMVEADQLAGELGIRRESRKMSDDVWIRIVYFAKQILDAGFDSE